MSRRLVVYRHGLHAESLCDRYLGDVEVLYVSKHTPVVVVRGEMGRLRARGLKVFRDGKVYALDLTPTSGRSITIRELYELHEGFPKIYGIDGRRTRIAVLDTGIRKTHVALRGKVIYEAYTIGEDADDHFDHGTGVASMLVGYAPDLGIVSPIPRGRLLNIKCIGDDGVGTVSSVVQGIDIAIERKAHFINMSIGRPFEEWDDPMMIACKSAIERGTRVATSAGNWGPDPSTIASPAADPDVCAVGCVYPDFRIWERSSRGPMDDVVKPNLVAVGVDVIVASSSSDVAVKVGTGTSISCPVVVAGAVMIDEYYLANYMRRPTQREELMLIPMMTTKPYGTPLPYQDNTYGYGVPTGSRALTFAGMTVRARAPYLRITTMMADFLRMYMQLLMIAVLRRVI